MKTSSKKSVILLISGILLATITALACAGGDWEGTEGSMFAPEIINQPQFKPFFRTTYTPFYDGYDDKSAEFFKKENCKDWLSYFGAGNMSEEALNYWLYTASINQVDSMIFDLKNKPSHLTEASKRYTLKALKAEKGNAFLYFLGFAKRNEAFAVKESEYSWEPKPARPAGVSLEKQIAGGINFLKKAQEPFMKERYAFQVERLYFFNQEYEKAIAVYDANQHYFTTENNIKWRALSYKAGALYKLKQFAQSNYLFSKIYSDFDPLKKSAFLCFHPQNEADWKSCLDLAKTTKEKEVLWQLYGLHADALTAMKEILKLNPASELADLLLVRTVNMQEEKFGGNLTTGHSNDSESKIKVDEKFVAFFNEVSASNKLINAGAWHLSAAYMNYISRNYEIADKQLKRAKETLKGNALMTAQYHLISLIGKIARIGSMNTTVESNLVADLRGVLDHKNDVKDLRVDYALAWMRQVLASYAKSPGEIEKAELIYPGSASVGFNKIQTIEKMIAYFEKTNTSEYEKLFFQYAPLNKFDYVELKAIRLAQQDKLEEALSTFKACQSLGSNLPGNPFTIHIKDCHDCDHEAIQKIKYNRISFLEKMIEMKSLANAKPEEAAPNYFLVANGFYNITHFGNAREFYGYNRVDGSFYYYGDKSLPEQQTDLALKYYLLAKQNSKDKEFRAKCTFMAAKCELNASYTEMDPENVKDDYIANKNFSILKKEFSDTKYYKEIIKECGYFRTYLGTK
ncbi:hypothetical protein CNR22_15740 [Sphingobacteriaceae bacterium]|nr:hypothetical protein CNR22_15740 [Sphingobacteriaceae bacterium]